VVFSTKARELNAIQSLFKAFVSWFHYAEEKKRKKVAITKALGRRQQWLHKVTVMQWIKVS
jgi:predicted lysophospholipase L1 biosynthesis ABC-type transport system permease subunit